MAGWTKTALFKFWCAHISSEGLSGMQLQIGEIWSETESYNVLNDDDIVCL